MSPRVNLPGPLGVIPAPPGWQKPCAAAQWNDGVRVIHVPPVPLRHRNAWSFAEVPSGAAADGLGGIFVLTTGTEYWPGSQGAFSLRHVSAVGVAGPLFSVEAPEDWVGVLGIWAEAVVVPSGAGNCILAWGKHQLGTPDDLTARRLDAAGAHLWANSDVRVTDDLLGKNSANNIVAEADGQEGALFGWWTLSPAGDLVARAQRVLDDGGLPWGANGVTLGTTPGSFVRPGPWLQLVATPQGGGIVVMPDSTAGAGSIRYVAQAISPGGVAAGVPTILVTAAPDDWFALQRLRVAVPDGAGGLFLGYTDAAVLRLLRFSPAQGVLWDLPFGPIVHERSFSVREDGRGGLLVASIGAGGGGLPRVDLRRIDRNGAVTWDIHSGANPSLAFSLPPQFSLLRREVWPRMAQAVPDGAGGAVLVFQDFSGGSARLWTVCFDPQGRLVNSVQAVTGRMTSQTLPLVEPLGGPAAAAAWSDDDATPADGLDVLVQRVGCCPVSPGGLEPYPQFGCELLAAPEGMDFRDMIFDLPCGDRDLQYGVIPLSRFFAQIRGLDYPGSLRNRDVPAPGWLTLAFQGAPRGTRVQLCSMKGTLLAESVPVRGGGKGVAGGISLTFAPSEGPDDQLLVFRHSGPPAAGPAPIVRVDCAWGDGEPGAPGRTGGDPRKRKGKRKAGAASSRARRASGRKGKGDARRKR